MHAATRSLVVTEVDRPIPSSFFGRRNPDSGPRGGACGRFQGGERWEAAQMLPLSHQAGEIFVGREQEMAALRASLEAALTGCGHVVLLAGEPGIGKTRTACELAAYARRRNVKVLLGRCYEGADTPPLWPWVQIMRAYVADSDPATLREEMGAGAAALAPGVPEVRELLAEFLTTLDHEPEQAHFRCCDRLTRFLKQVSQRQPMVLILDDLHWAHPLSLRLLQFMARDLGDARRCLVIGTYRDIEFGGQHPLTRAVGELIRNRAVRAFLCRGSAKGMWPAFSHASPVSPIRGPGNDPLPDERGEHVLHD